MTVSDRSYMAQHSKSLTLVAWIIKDQRTRAEGRVSQQWRSIQEDHYLLFGLCRTAHRWAKGLVQNLLALVHKQWIAHNAVVHKHDDRGLKLKDRKELKAAIAAQFELGTEGLLHKNCHFIDRGKQAVANMIVPQKKMWLHSIQLA